MRNFKNLLIIMVALLPLSSAFGFVGFGLNFGQNKLGVSSFSPITVATLSFTRGGFDNANGYGGYFYIDAIPFIDLDAEFQVSKSEYKLKFSDTVSGKGIDGDFAWGGASTYLTARKKLFGIGVPFLANAKLHYGVGFNKHVVTPMTDLDTVKGLVSSGSGSLNDRLKDYLTDNKIDVSGFHVQAGLKAKLLMGEVDLFYRYVIAEDIVPDSDGFGSLNLRLGVAF